MKQKKVTFQIFVSKIFDVGKISIFNKGDGHITQINKMSMV